MAAPEEILQLVETFERNQGAYRSGGYNEAQLRQEFINPLFMGLGWDVNNRAGYAEAYKDVIHEDSIKIGGATKEKYHKALYINKLDAFCFFGLSIAKLEKSFKLRLLILGRILVLGIL
jgi:hypothetical protein